MKIMDAHSMVILGNGFDVALGIPTRYSQFYNSNELRVCAKKGNTLCQHILHNLNCDLWSDLESGLYQYSLDLTQRFGEGSREHAEIFKKEFEELRTALFDYLKKVSGKSVEISQQTPIIGLNIEWHKLQPQYLTFNYSINTANAASMNSRYILNGDDSINETHFIYQHGSIYNTQACRSNNSDDIVLGIDPIIQQVEPSHSFLYKGQQNQHDLNSTLVIINEKKLYVIYGCSIGESDATYFRAIFNPTQQHKTFLIYGFGLDKIAEMKYNIERICKINVEEFSSHNHVFFLDVQQVTKTRKITRDIIDNYLTLI